MRDWSIDDPEMVRDKSLRAPFDSPSSMDNEASKFLLENGHSELARIVTRPELMQPMKSYGEKLREPPNGRIHEPKGDSRGPAKAKGRPCPGCGSPLSKYSQNNPEAICRACYGKQALERHDKRVGTKWVRVDEHYARYSWLCEQYIKSLSGVTRDFSAELINDISHWEETTGIPFAFWAEQLEVSPPAGLAPREVSIRMKTEGWRAPKRKRNRNLVRQGQTEWRYAA